MDRKVKCRFCKKEIFMKDFRAHLRVMHPQLVRAKIQEVERIESLNESSLLLMFSMMEMLHEVPPNAGDLLAEEAFSGKGGESGGGGASGSFDDCDKKCESCDLHEQESILESDSSSGSSDSGSNNND